MKTILLIFFLFCGCGISAQLTITPGAEFHLSGNALLTLRDIDLVNNGNFTTGNSMVSFRGNSTSAISGTQPVQFYEAEINKVSGGSVLLQRMISITRRVLFTSGFLDLNGFDADLGTTAYLDGEAETNRIIGPNGGQVLFSTSLNAPSAANPANMGAIITSSQNLGNVIIKRGHQTQFNGSGMGSSVLRYFDISPVNNTGLNATLRFHYFENELNSLDENTLVFWKSPDNSNWSNEGFTSRNTTGNYVEKTGVNSFSRWTLSSIDNTLPVQFILFNAKCDGDNIVINFKTAQEQNSSHFNIEKSTDGIRWVVIGRLPAAGNRNNESSYLFTDTNPVQNSYYRIAEFDFDRRVQYTSILRSSCDTRDVFKVWPNPVNKIAFINISANNGSPAIIKVFDNKGALIKIQKATLLQGSNQINVDMKKWSGGIYHIVAEWNNGQMKKTVQVVKQ